MARYFLSNVRKSDGTPKAGTFWRESQPFAGGVYYQHNLHLLAHCLGDRPCGASLAPPRVYDTERTGRSSNVALTLQPFVRESRIGAMPVLAPLPLGAGLRKFLDDPLQNGRRLNLTLPFCDADMHATYGCATRAPTVCVDPYFFLAAGYPTIREIELQMAQVVRGAFEQSKTAADRSMELQLMDLLREAFLEQKRVKLAYRSASGNRYISAAWVEH